MNRQLKAFLLALVLFAATIAAGSLFTAKYIGLNNPDFSFWTREAKSGILEGLQENLNDGSFPVFGSSEFQHGLGTPFHPAAVFAGGHFNPMLIGAGYYQSLSHAVTLAAIEPALENRKAVLIVSPQWFRKTGVVDQAYASRFSETLYYGMLDNENLSDALKEKLKDRTMELMGVDERTCTRLERHDLVLSGEASAAGKAMDLMWRAFLKEKDRYMLTAGLIKDGLKEGDGIPEEEPEPDWEALLAQAELAGEQENTNEFFMRDEVYARLLPHLPKKKGMNADAKKGYQTGPEFGDLQLFLDVCRELGITPMLVLMPVNGYYYDYTGFPKTAREAYYQKVRGIAEENGVRVADFSDQEYTKYFFEDRVHLGQKGWVLVNKSLYDFYMDKAANGDE